MPTPKELLDEEYEDELLTLQLSCDHIAGNWHTGWQSIHTKCQLCGSDLQCNPWVQRSAPLTCVEILCFRRIGSVSKIARVVYATRVFEPNQPVGAGVAIEAFTNEVGTTTHLVSVADWCDRVLGGVPASQWADRLTAAIGGK
jgi:hypothetical protein